MLTTCETRAACIDVVDFATELPASITTAGGTTIAYDYDLQRDHYTMSWQTRISRGGPFGPFAMTMSCGTVGLRWETDEFLVFTRGCGTFCWYAKIFGLIPGTEPYRKIDRPLAFDVVSDLLAVYSSQDTIEVRNLQTDYTQSITTEQCQFASGLCFSDVTFTEQTLTYTWRSSGEQFSVNLDSDLF